MMHKTKEDISHEYLAELKQGSFHVLTLSTVFFLYSAYQTHSKISSKNRDVDAISSVCLNLLMSKWWKTLMLVHTTLTNIIMKTFVLNESGRGKELGCLRSKKQSNCSCIDMLFFSVSQPLFMQKFFIW